MLKVYADSLFQLKSVSVVDCLSYLKTVLKQMLKGVVMHGYTERKLLAEGYLLTQGLHGMNRIT